MHSNDPITVTELNMATWDQIKGVYPYNVIGVPDFDKSRVVIAQNHLGAIIGYWVLFETVHVEPLWIHPDHRGRPSLIRKLWNKVVDILRESGTPFAFTTVSPKDEIKNGDQAKRLGFKELPGKMYFLIPEKALRLKVEQDEKAMELAKQAEA